MCLMILGSLLAASNEGHTWLLTEAGLRPARFLFREIPAPGGQVDMNSDGLPEEIYQEAGQAAILQGLDVLWASPESWQVKSARLGDLNRDGALELVLLVWRSWQPWPVDRVLPYGGRIDEFQNAAGMSCHLILIGWRGQAFGERWAGSALADPLIDIAVADLDGDGREELAALEGRYADPSGSLSRSLTVWEWNGFGFSLVDRLDRHSRQVRVSVQDQTAFLVTTP